MPRAPKRRHYLVEEELDSESEAQGLLGAWIPRAVEEDTSSSSSTASSSFPSSSSSSSVTSSSPSPLEEICIFYDTPSPPQSPVSSSYSCPALASTPLSQPSCQEMEVSSTSQALPDTESLPSFVMDGKVGALAEFLLLKYRTKEVTTKAEMLSRVMREHQDHFRAIFSETCECLQLVFGVDVKEVDPSDHSYVMVTSLGLTYDGMWSDEHSMPKTGLLILILCIIFVEGNRVPEEEIWERISSIEIYAGSEHPIYGEPRELITRIFVQEQYLEYQQVSNSNPARYVFLWGPRAHAETSKLKILEFLAEINNCDPRSFPMWYEEAIRDQEERAQARIATDMASASSSAMSGRFSCLE